MFQTGFANPIDRAIRDRREFDTSGVEKLDEIPYDFIRKRLSVRVAENGQKLLITKGALAQVLECCTQAAMPGGELVDLAEQRAAIDRRFAEMSHEGLRVLGLAIRAVDAPHVSKADEQGMTFLGLPGLRRPAQSRRRQMIAQSAGPRRRAEGHHRRQPRGGGDDQPPGGDRITDALSPAPTCARSSGEAFVQRACQADVFAEVEPNQKEQIILALKQSGEVVGYLGDGINDASALACGGRRHLGRFRRRRGPRSRPDRVAPARPRRPRARACARAGGHSPTR